VKQLASLSVITLGKRVWLVRSCLLCGAEHLNTHSCLMY
jgi:hypothetical protein